MSGILNFLVDGYRLMLETGLDVPVRVADAIAAYRNEADIIGSFLAEYTIGFDEGKLATGELYKGYAEWAKQNGYKPLSNRSFVGELRRRVEVKHDRALGNVVVGLSLASECPFL
jgi:putative DNA primase/helicase